MADNKKYYYLKLKDNFFDSDAMIVLESMPDGYLYSNILLKLYLRSLKYKGKLMFNEMIPYNTTILAQVTRHSVGVIEKALDIFINMGLIEVMNNGAIFMLDIQNFIGRSSTEAERKKEYRERIKEEKGQMSLKSPDISTPKKEKDLDLKKETEIKGDKSPPKHAYGEYQWVKLSDDQYNKLIKDIGQAELMACIKHIDESAQSTENKNKWKDWNLVVRRCQREEWHKRYKAKPEKSSNPFKDILKELENEQEGNRNVDGDYQDSISGVLPEPDGFDRRG